MIQSAPDHLANLYAYQGGYFRLLQSPEQTNGQVGLLEMTLRKGGGPPRHVHTLEDETTYVLEGSMRFDIGGKIVMVGAGQSVFAPRNVEHQFSIESEQVRLLVLFTPGDLTNFFVEFSHPITELPSESELQPRQAPPKDVLEYTVKRSADRYQVYFV